VIAHLHGIARFLLRIAALIGVSGGGEGHGRIALIYSMI